MVSFGYDNRGRLISEVRSDSETPDASYDLAYTYDQGGNRNTKVQTLDGSNRIETIYHYDLEAPQAYGSNNNRLMYYETYEISNGLLEGDGGPGVGRDHETRREGGGTVGSGDPTYDYDLSLRDAQCAEQRTLLSTTWYYYNDSGNVTRVVTNEPGTDDYQAVWMVYARNEQALAYAVGETWNWDGNPSHNPTNRSVLWGREFRYDAARQRYLNRVLDPDYLELGGIRPMPGVPSVWSDYDGDEIYGDFTVNDGVVTNERSFELGLAKTDPWTDSGGANTQYYHADMIGSTRLITDSTGSDVEPVVYTAFGERINGTAHRYGYAGAYGYQAHDEFPFLHVGHRYYDPSTGRFLQRDPIGIVGGLNVYAYVENSPFEWIDPSGLQAAPCPVPPSKYLEGAAGADEALDRLEAECSLPAKPWKRPPSDRRIGDHKDPNIPDWPTHRPRVRPAPEPKPGGEGGGCGATGAEVIPFALLCVWLKTRARRLNTSRHDV